MEKALANNLANNILKRAFRDNIPVNPMKLQRLLYIACLRYARETGHVPIHDRFHVWATGPVLVSTHAMFSCFGTRAIPDGTYAKDARGRCRCVSERDNPTLARILDETWACCKHATAAELTDYVRRPGSAWWKAYQSGNENQPLRDKDIVKDEAL